MHRALRIHAQVQGIQFGLQQRVGQRRSTGGDAVDLQVIARAQLAPDVLATRGRQAAEIAVERIEIDRHPGQRHAFQFDEATCQQRLQEGTAVCIGRLVQQRRIDRKVLDHQQPGIADRVARHVLGQRLRRDMRRQRGVLGAGGTDEAGLPGDPWPPQARQRQAEQLAAQCVVHRGGQVQRRTEGWQAAGQAACLESERRVGQEALQQRGRFQRSAGRA
ncbi:hypothetical protein G6F35_011626 [Rhizopus arrhizus]|nr:hypothetical protein G6F35_011626 [Rhizopus arrhizus]